MWTTSAQERALLETCLSKAKAKLDEYRETGNDLMAAMTEADVNRILEELQRIYKRSLGGAKRL